MDVDITPGTESAPEIPKPDHDKANATALELVKQIITLSAGVLALSATFGQKFLTASLLLIVPLAMAWLLLLLAIYAGLQAIDTLVNAQRHPEFPWAPKHIRRYASTSKFCFTLGISSFAIFAFLSFLVNAAPQ